ncbi:MAG: bifunctional 4-hydroxy-2-oxoglutarate aldolase/2-dehydro-3-deoxy-phosphogluconate aldolase [Bacteroidota bacterium]
MAEKLVVIIRTTKAVDVLPIIDALVTANVGTVEVTSNTPNFEDKIEKARATYPDTLIGAGTIISVELAEKAIGAGAQFLVTPSVEPEVGRYAHDRDIPVLMGALTPTEISAALKSNADIVKLFPADIMGIDYLKAIMGPFDDVPIFAVGGIAIESAKAWIDAGAKGLGLGGNLTRLDGTSTAPIQENARKLLKLLT